MKIKHQEIEITPEQPFANCKLGREKYASILTNIVDTYADGFVMAINSEWGTGKTTFVKMWQCQLENNGFKTLYFNAWETDFEDNPLIALIAEFKALTNSSDDKTFKTLLKKGAVLTKNLAPTLAKSIADNYKFARVIADVAESATKGTTEILEEEINLYAKKKSGIKEFKKALHDFVASIDSDKPIIFIIDELDRCRPSYSVALLEQMKHLFSVPDIVFVLSIDKKQLGNAVRGVYGSDRIDADEYLRRFIDLEYSIPEPDTKTFCQYLYDYFNFDSFFVSDDRRRIKEFYNDRKEFITVASILFEKANLSLRQQEKIFAHARIGLSSFKSNQYVFPGLYLTLLYLKNYESDFYCKLQLKKLDINELISEFFKLLPSGIPEILFS